MSRPARTARPGWRLALYAGVGFLLGLGFMMLFARGRSPAPIPAPASSPEPPAAATDPPAGPPQPAPPARERPAAGPGATRPHDEVEVFDEGRDMDQIRALVRSDPRRALALIDAADRSHPDSPFAEERSALRVDALVFAQRIGPARDAAEEFLARYPHSPRAQHVEMLTGVHPRPADPQD